MRHALDAARRASPGCRSRRRTRSAVRLPPSACQSGWPLCFACRSHAAISMTALAMMWPRTRAIAGQRSRGCANVATQHERREKLREDVPDRFRRLAAVVRIVLGDGLAPALRAVAVHGDEHEHAIVGPREAGFEVAHQRQPQQSNVEAVDCHERMAGAARPARIAQPRRIIACRPWLACRRIATAILRPRWTSATSLSRARLASASRRWPNAWRLAWMRRSSSKTPRTRSSRTSTPIGRARRFRPSSSTCSRGIVSKARCRQSDLFSQVDDLRLHVRPRQDLRVPEPRRQRAVHLPAAVRSARARRARARSRHLPPGADRRAAPPAEGEEPRRRGRTSSSRTGRTFRN